MKMVIELSSVYEGDVEELQNLSKEIEDLTRYANDMENDTVLRVLKTAKQSKQNRLKKKLSEILGELDGKDLFLCSASREPENEEGYHWF